jgi:hypothetical protein
MSRFFLLFAILLGFSTPVLAFDVQEIPKEAQLNFDIQDGKMTVTEAQNKDGFLYHSTQKYQDFFKNRVPKGELFVTNPHNDSYKIFNDDPDLSRKLLYMGIRYRFD